MAKCRKMNAAYPVARIKKIPGRRNGMRPGRKVFKTLSHEMLMDTVRALGISGFGEKDAKRFAREADL